MDLDSLFKRHGHLLEPRDRKIVKMKLAGKTLRQIGQAVPNRQAGKVDHDNGGVYGSTLSPERARQLLNLAISKMEKSE